MIVVPIGSYFLTVNTVFRGISFLPRRVIIETNHKQETLLWLVAWLLSWPMSSLWDTLL